MAPKIDAKAAEAAITAHKGRWRRRATPNGGYVRVMSIVEGYVVARFSGAAPFVTHANQWAAEFEIATQWNGGPR